MRADDRAQPDEVEQRRLDVQRGEPLAQQRVVAPAVRAHAVEQVERRSGPMPHSTPPDDSDTRSLPRVTLASAQPSFDLADEVLGRDAHVGEEHLVERVRAGHLDDRPDLDARARPSGR